jgi:hypothetical protein
MPKWKVFGKRHTALLLYMSMSVRSLGQCSNLDLGIMQNKRKKEEKPKLEKAGERGSGLL